MIALAISMKVYLDYNRLAGALRTWSDYHVSEGSKNWSWDSANLLVRNAVELDGYAVRHLEDALARSSAELWPLSEPLKTNMGSHRWLSSDREESYSDWLAWILQGMSGGDEILPLFDLDDACMGDLIGPAENIRREEWSEHGRTDIQVRWRDKRGLLLIEVKVQDPGSELGSQLERYSQRVAREGVDCSLKVLLAAEAPSESIEPYKFKFTDWRTLCQRLRRYACRVKESELLRAAAILIFCGAAEQNLFGLSAQPRRFRAMATVNYLREWRQGA
jgi:hypothetical protein